MANEDPCRWKMKLGLNLDVFSSMEGSWVADRLLLDQQRAEKTGKQVSCGRCHASPEAPSRAPHRPGLCLSPAALPSPDLQVSWWPHCLGPDTSYFPLILFFSTALVFGGFVCVLFVRSPAAQQLLALGWHSVNTGWVNKYLAGGRSGTGVSGGGIPQPCPRWGRAASFRN